MASTNPVSKSRIVLGRKTIKIPQAACANDDLPLVMTFGPEKAAGARVTELSDFEMCLDYFQEQAYGEVDTGEFDMYHSFDPGSVLARVYVGGQQEAFTAKAGWKQRGLKLATKIYPTQPGDHKSAALTEAFIESLSALETDRVDILYLHAPDRTVPFAETLKAVDKLYRAQRFTQLGLSNFTAFEVAEVVMTCQANGWVRPTIYQAIYNVITRTIETELVPACRRYGLELLAYNPLAGGLFSGKYSLTAVPGTGRFSSDSTLQGSQYRARYFREEYFEALALIEPVAQKHGLTLIEIAIRWLIHHSVLNTRARNGGNDGIIVGISGLNQLEANLRDAEKPPLPKEVLAVLDQAWKICKGDTPDYWQNQPLEYAYDTREVLFGR